MRNVDVAGGHWRAARKKDFPMSSLLLYFSTQDRISFNRRNGIPHAPNLNEPLNSGQQRANRIKELVQKSFRVGGTECGFFNLSQLGLGWQNLHWDLLSARKLSTIED